MTVGAAVAESAGMRVIDGMTCDAVGWRILVSSAYMTSDTARRLMCTDQGMIGLVVIESVGTPVGLAVAVATFRRQSAIVGIIIAMTVDAIRRGIPSTYVRKMTLCTCSALVRAEQWVVCLCVIERRFTEAPDVGASPRVISMTGSTLPTRRKSVAAVETLTR